jgi:uncharacterized membrane protein
MFAVGGLCFLLIGSINGLFPWSMGIAWQALIGAAAVTLVELVCGIILNVWLGLGIWDYSSLPLNLFGQICPQFAAAWIPLAAFGVWLDDYLRYRLFGEEKPHYKCI